MKMNTLKTSLGFMVTMLEKTTPLNFSGGNVMGTRMMVLKIPLSPRIFQNDLLLRPRSMIGLPRGKRYLPTFNVRAALVTLAEHNSGR